MHTCSIKPKSTGAFRPIRTKTLAQFVSSFCRAFRCICTINCFPPQARESPSQWHTLATISDDRRPAELAASSPLPQTSENRFHSWSTFDLIWFEKRGPDIRGGARCVNEFVMASRERECHENRIGMRNVHEMYSVLHCSKTHGMRSQYHTKIYGWFESTTRIAGLKRLKTNAPKHTNVARQI